MATERCAQCGTTSENCPLPNHERCLFDTDPLSEIEALRSRVAAQDTELTRLRGLVGSLTDVIESEFHTAHAGIVAEARAEVPR
jgi:hypothetical protein